MTSCGWAAGLLLLFDSEQSFEADSIFSPGMHPMGDDIFSYGIYHRRKYRRSDSNCKPWPAATPCKLPSFPSNFLKKLVVSDL